MPNIFGSMAGRIIAIASDDGFMPLGVDVADFKDAVGAKGLVTGLSMTGQSGYQVMHTLRQYIYIYTFGERVGEITVSGLSFNLDCTQDLPANNTGLAKLYNWYQANRISTTGAHIALTLSPGLTVNAFLVDFRYQVEDPSIGLAQFSLHFIYPPSLVRPGQIVVPPAAGVITAIPPLGNVFTLSVGTS